MYSFPTLCQIPVPIGISVFSTSSDPGAHRHQYFFLLFLKDSSVGNKCVELDKSLALLRHKKEKLGGTYIFFE